MLYLCYNLSRYLDFFLCWSHLNFESLNEQLQSHWFYLSDGNVYFSRRSAERPRSCSAQRHSSVTRSSKLLSSVNSVIANQSLTASETDTLTGVHLDNSSQFGIPPVFNAKGRTIPNTALLSVYHNVEFLLGTLHVRVFLLVYFIFANDHRKNITCKTN